MCIHIRYRSDKKNLSITNYELCNFRMQSKNRFKNGKLYRWDIHIKVEINLHEKLVQTSE